MSGRRPLILRAVSRMAIGGVQRGLIATLSRADRERYDYAMLCTKKAGKWAPKIEALGVPVHLQKTLPPWDPYQIWRLSRVIRRIAPDLVHIHMAPMVIPVASACVLAGVKRYVIQWHSNYERFWGGQFGWLRAWERQLTRRARAVMCVSRSAARANAGIMRVPLESVRVIPNGIDLELWRGAEPVDPRPAWGLEPKTPVVAHVSRYLPTKNIEDFIRAAAIVHSRWPGKIGGDSVPPPAFAVMGSGAQNYRDRYEACIRQVRDQAPGVRVWLEGDRHDLPSLLPCVQVGVLATENEGCPNTILEYLGIGLPMVASDIPPVAELVRHGEMALLTPPRDVEALAVAIERLLLDRALAGRLSEACRAEASRHDWILAAREYEAVYEEVLAAGGTSQ